MPEDTSSSAPPSVPAPELTQEQLTRIQNEKLVEEVKKTQVEIRKLDAEVTQLTKPYRTFPFWFTLATTVFSAIAAVTAVYGITLQSSLHRQDVDNLKKTKIDLDNELARLGKERDTQVQASVRAQKSLEAKKNELKDAEELANTAKLAKKDADDSLETSAKLTLQTFDYLEKRAKAEPTEPTSVVAYEIQFAKELLANFLKSLQEDKHNYRVLVSMLTYDSANIRRYGALILSLQDKGNVPALSDRAKYAQKILDAMLAEKEVESRRLEVTAIARLGAEAAKPLLAGLRSEQGEPKLNVVRALGELGPEATEDVISELVKLFKEADKQLQRQAVLALGTIGPAAARAEDPMVRLLPAKLAGLFDDSDTYGLSLEVVSSLRKIGAARPDTIAGLLPLLGFDDPRASRQRRDNLRKELLMTLGGLGFKAAPAAKKSLDAATEKIQDIVKSETNPALLEEAAITLGRIGGAKEIESLAQSEAPRLQLAALVGLTSLESPKDRESILTILLKGKSGENFLTPSAILSLKNRGKDSLPVLAEVLPMIKKNSFARENIVNAIGDVGKDSEQALGALTVGIQDSNAYVQVAAIHSLQRLGLDSSKPVREVIEQLASDPKGNEMVRHAAQAAVFSAVAPEQAFKGELKPDPSGDKVEKYHVAYSYKFEVGFLYQIDVMSREFDAFLYVKKNGKTLGFDDDSGGNLNARLFFDPPATDTYEVWATSYARQARGNFTVEIRKLQKKG
jgi:hypothetical protein